MVRAMKAPWLNDGVITEIEKDMLIVRQEAALKGGRFMVCVDGSSYSYNAMRSALELAQEFGASLFVCSAFDVEYHHVVFGNIKDVLSVQASIFWAIRHENRSMRLSSRASALR